MATRFSTVVAPFHSPASDAARFQVPRPGGTLAGGRRSLAVFRLASSYWLTAFGTFSGAYGHLYICFGKKSVFRFTGIFKLSYLSLDH